MAARIGYAGTQNVGDVLTSSNFSKMPNGLVAYVAYTSNSATFTNSETDLNANLTITFTAGTSRTYEVYIVGEASSTVNNDTIRIYLSDLVSGNGTHFGFTDTSVSGSGQQGFYLSVLIQPSSGTQNFHARALRQSGTGNCSILGTAAAGSGITGVTHMGVRDLGLAF